MKCRIDGANSTGGTEVQNGFREVDVGQIVNSISEYMIFFPKQNEKPKICFKQKNYISRS